jgi:hypothetical protein
MLRKKSLKDLLTGYTLKGHSGLGRVGGLHHLSPDTHKISLNNDDKVLPQLWPNFVVDGSQPSSTTR